jgi:glycosyltransferase involved in cell wall biosynthesis
MKPTEPKPDISVILPAYNESSSIEYVIKQIQTVLSQSQYVNEILVIDDGSTDDTAIVSRNAGARVIRQPYNMGNGAAIKTGIRNSRGNIIVMLDADGQHPPEDIPRLLEKMGTFDMAVGARTAASDTDKHRDFANKIYNGLATYVSGKKIDDLTSGFRAIKKSVAKKYVYLLPNRFSYPTTITLSVIRAGHSLVYVPIVGKRRIGKSNIRVIRDGFRFLIIILKITTIYAPMKIFVPVSMVMFFTGFFYGLFRVFGWRLPYGQTSAMLMTIAVLVFMVGLVSEQVAQLRYDRSEFYDEQE